LNDAIRTSSVAVEADFHFVPSIGHEHRRQIITRYSLTIKVNNLILTYKIGKVNAEVKQSL
jgi:hypothetical protein